ncbi:MAG: potassium channel family protein [Candidatus Odinarchaeia archaeon]
MPELYRKKEELLEIVKSLFKTLKNRSELMVDLAYSSFLFNSKEIAEDVSEMEEEVDSLHIMFEEAILSLAAFIENPAKLHSMLRLGIATENIADAANQVAEVVLRSITPHPIFLKVINESEETIIRVRVRKDSKLVNKSIKEAKISTETGMKIIALKKKDDWIYSPKDYEVIMEDYIIIAKGPPEGAKELAELASGKIEEGNSKS